jgi:hypothetical protein
MIAADNPCYKKMLANPQSIRKAKSIAFQDLFECPESDKYGYLRTDREGGALGGGWK